MAGKQAHCEEMMAWCCCARWCARRTGDEEPSRQLLFCRKKLFPSRRSVEHAVSFRARRRRARPSLTEGILGRVGLCSSKLEELAMSVTAQSGGGWLVVFFFSGEVGDVEVLRLSCG